MTNWEVVIGLEIHIQLKTNTKLFSGAAVAFGVEPNANACAIDLGMPGTLPVPNAKAFDMAIQLGLALGCDINQLSVFERKNYFYPDLPKGYQTTQLQKPIVGSGIIKLMVDGAEFAIRIDHAHLEEDAGKSVHNYIASSSCIDYNRAGTALIELVTEPDFRTSKQASAFLRYINQIVTYIGISDGDMSQGSMRCDANVSIKPKTATKLGTRTELKNINSYKFVEQAIEIETDRQIAVLEAGGSITQETRLFDENKLETRSMRSKELENDYRYFPCPDLLPVFIDSEHIASLKANLAELPPQKQQRFIVQYKLSEAVVTSLIKDKNLCDFFEATVAAGASPTMSLNWLQSELSALLNANSKAITASQVTPEQLAAIITLIKQDKISGKIAKTLLTLVWNANTQKLATVTELVQSQGLAQVADTDAIGKVVAEVIANNPQQVANYLAADPDKSKKMLGFFVGRVMQATKGQASPKLVNQELLKQLK